MAQFLQPLSLQEAAYSGFTHFAKIRAGVELTETTVALAQTLKLGTQRVGEVIRRSVVSPITPFRDVSDAAYNTTTLTVKTLTSAGADKVVLHAALELNLNGTEITTDQPNVTPTVAAVAGDTLVAVIGSMAAKAIADLDQGVVHIYFEIIAPIQISQANVQPLLAQGFTTAEQLMQVRGCSFEDAQKALQEEALIHASGKGKGESEGEDVDYEEKTVPELKELANERGVDVPYDARKDEIIKALKKADKEGATAKA